MKILSYILGFMILTIGSSAFAAQCGEGIKACECGDTLVGRYTLTQDLVCQGHGLIISEGGQLFGKGKYGITGPAKSGKRAYGIYMKDINKGVTNRRDAVQTIIQGVRIENFTRGIRLSNVHWIVLSKNTIRRNGHSESPRGCYGLDFSGVTGSTNNIVEANEIQGNLDAGIYLGSGSSYNKFYQNNVYGNGYKNIALTGAVGNDFSQNTLSGSRRGLELKNSTGNKFVENRIQDAPVVLVGQSTGNKFLENKLVGTNLKFAGFNPQNPVTFPSANRFEGGKITNPAGSCLEFHSAFSNKIRDVKLRCGRPVVSTGRKHPKVKAPAFVNMVSKVTLNGERFKKTSTNVQEYHGTLIRVSR